MYLSGESSPTTVLDLNNTENHINILVLPSNSDLRFTYHCHVETVNPRKHLLLMLMLPSMAMIHLSGRTDITREMCLGHMSPEVTHITVTPGKGAEAYLVSMLYT